MVYNAISSHRTTNPSRPALRIATNNESGKGPCKKVRFDDDEVSNVDEFVQMAAPRHWNDEYHEPDGTHPSLITGDFHQGHAERIRRKLKDSPLIADVRDREPRTLRAVARDMYFNVGPNVGAELLTKHLSELVSRNRATSCVDDVSGEALDEAGVRAARALEMEFFQKMGVYTYATREEAARSGRGKVIKGRWIDVSKGDSQNPDYRSRFVGEVQYGNGLQPLCRHPPLRQ